MLTPASALLAVTLQLCMRDGACQPTQDPASQTTTQAPAKQQPPAPKPQQPPEKTSSINNTIDAGEADAYPPPERRMSRWNEFDGKWASIRFGWGFAVDYGAFKQDAGSEEQFTLDNEGKLRDFRFLLKGRLKFFGTRKVTYTAGIMYDGRRSCKNARNTSASRRLSFPATT